MVLASFDTEALSGDPELARIAQFAAKLCGTDSAAVSLVELEKQLFLASEGVDVTETPRSTSFCSHTMLTPDILEVLDATQDERFANFSLVRGEGHLRFYAGAPLISSEGASLGALCVLGTEVREEPLTDFQRDGLLVLAEAVKRRLYAHRFENTANSKLRESASRVQFVLNSLPDIAWSAGPGPKFDYFNARFGQVTGRALPQTTDDWRAVTHPDDFEDTRIKFEAALRDAIPFEDEWRLRLADGSYRYVLSRAVPSSDDPKSARWFGTITDIDDGRRTLEERELLAGELAHRIKNIFSVITGLVSLHARGDATLSLFAQTLTDNIRALSRAQEFALRIDTHSENNLKGLLNVLMAPYGVPGQIAVEVSGDDVATGPRSATPLALVFHELATNSAKYGALSVAKGKVAIDVTRQSDEVEIVWREIGGPDTEAPENVGFGSRLVKMAVENQLGGKILQDWQTDGLITRITVSVARLEN